MAKKLSSDTTLFFVTVALLGAPTVYAAFGDRVAITVSSPSPKTPSSIGVTTIWAEL